MKWLNKIVGKEDAESLINSLERSYFDLKKNNPERDEQWLLAQTWLMRYGLKKEAREKGPKLMRFISYKDTFQFAILDSPKSIRAMALLLVNNELGEKEARGGVQEFSTLMDYVWAQQRKHKFLDEYKRKNPQTWNEIQLEKDSTIYGLYGFFQAADHFEKDPEAENRAIQDLAKLDSQA